MFKNYFKIALRNLVRYKGYSLINILGLAIGMTCCILILLFVQDELSYDRFHANADYIFRLERQGVFQGREYHVPITAHPYGPTLVADFPEVESMVRLWDVELNVRDPKMQFIEETLYFADETLFDVFSFDLKEGDPETALQTPSSVVLTEGMARRYFGETAPIGKSLSVTWDDSVMSLQVTGILADIPQNAHFHTDFFVSYSTLDILLGQQMQVWLSNSIVTYLQLSENVAPESLEAKLPPFVEKYMGDAARGFLGPDIDVSKLFELKVRPITEIHLYSDLEHELEANGSIATVYIFSAIALLILVIAAINFMNLATARSARRSKEVGLRKVVGAQRSVLITQFLGESTLISLLALGLGVLLAELALPAYNAFTLKALSIDYLGNPAVPLTFAGIVLFIGLLAGLYPAFFLSAFQPVQAMKGTISRTQGRASFLREGLVVLQFGISVVLIVSTMIVSRQLEFARSKKLGFDKQQVVVIPIQDRSMVEKFNVVRDAFLQDPDILKVASAGRYPGAQGFSDTIWRRAGTSGDDFVVLQQFRIGQGFVPAMDMQMVAGRNFSRQFSTDKDGIILNESAVVELGWDSPQDAIGREVEVPRGASPDDLLRATVIGVVRDFHFKSMRQKIESLVLHTGLLSSGIDYAFARVRPGNLPETIRSMKETWLGFSPDYPFDYFFLDQRFDSQYRAEERMQEVFGYFTALALFVGCLGLLGLASFTAEQRTKEIGIRKVLGASESSIVALLAQEFVKLVVISTVLATPLAYFAMRNWLENFAYRTEIGWQVFIVSGGLVLMVALITVSFQAVKAALANPVDALQYE